MNSAQHGVPRGRLRRIYSDKRWTTRIRCSRPFLDPFNQIDMLQPVNGQLRLLLNALAALLALGVHDDGPLERVGKLVHEPIREASGLVKSRAHPDVFWTHNDSGNEPRIFAVRRDGSLVAEFKIGAANIDWEAIALDSDDNLWIADIGNNSHKLPVRALYRIKEPNPNHPRETAIVVDKSIRYAAPTEGGFDSEACFIRGGALNVISKDRDDRPARIYQIPLDAKTSLIAPAIPKLVGTLAECVEPVTDACLNRDQKRLAVCGNAFARVYEPKTDDGWRIVAELKFPDHGFEAVCWDDDDLILASEDRSMWRIKSRDLRIAEPAKAQQAKDAGVAKHRDE